MSERTVPPEAWHRLHPLTVLTELLRLVGQFAYLLVAALAARFLGASERFDDPFLAAVGGAGVLIALLRYLSLRYAVWEGTLYLRRGVLFRQARTIPIDRIQNIDLKQNLLGRLTGVVDVKVETASGSGAEAELSVLSRAAAERLKAELAARRPPAAPDQGADGAHGSTDGPVPGPAPFPAATAPDVRVPIWQATLGDLLLLGATQNRAGAILGGIASLFFFFEGIAGISARAGEDAANALFGMAPWATAAIAFLALVLLVAGGWILSIVFTVVKYAGFTLAGAGDDRLVRSYGLTTRYESVIPLRRVQALRLVANWPKRALGYWTVYAETAGSFVDKEAGGASIVVPLLDGRERAAFARRIFPGLELDAAEWQPVSRHAIRRGFLRAARLIVLLYAAVRNRVGALAVVAAPAPARGRRALGLAALARAALGAGRRVLAGRERGLAAHRLDHPRGQDPVGRGRAEPVPAPARDLDARGGDGRRGARAGGEGGRPAGRGGALPGRGACGPRRGRRGAAARRRVSRFRSASPRA